MRYFSWRIAALMYYSDPIYGATCTSFAQSVMQWFQSYNVTVSYTLPFQQLMTNDQVISALQAIQQYARSTLF
jgi:hypothetical protein